LLKLFRHGEPGGSLPTFEPDDLQSLRHVLEQLPHATSGPRLGNSCAPDIPDTLYRNNVLAE
jgi:hypothetical protein